MDPYSVLRVSRDCSFDEICKAYEALSGLYHPDQNEGNKLAAVKFVQLCCAFEQIKRERKACEEAQSEMTVSA